MCEQENCLGLSACSGEDSDIFSSTNTLNSQSSVILLPSQLPEPATALWDILPKLLETCKYAAILNHEAIEQEKPLISHMHIFMHQIFVLPYQACRERTATARGPWLCKLWCN